MKKLLLLALLLSACVTPGPNNPSPSPSPSPIAVPSPTATPLPSPGGSSQLPADQYKCYGPDIYPAAYAKQVEEAERAYVADEKNKEKFKPGTECLYPVYWDSYYFDVVDKLNKLYPLEAIVDDCGGEGICGEIVVKGKGVKMGSGFSEGYSILVSSGCVRHNYGGSYRGRCSPSWWEK